MKKEQTPKEFVGRMLLVLASSVDGWMFSDTTPEEDRKLRQVAALIREAAFLLIPQD